MAIPKRGLLIGRFQPFHVGHMKAVEQVLSEYDEVVVAIGSSQYSFTPENPFTAGERVEMIRIGVKSSGRDLSRVIAIPVPDIGEHHLWMSRLVATVPSFQTLYTNNPFVKLLAENAGVKVREPRLYEREKLNGTEIRRLILQGGPWEQFVQQEVAEYIKSIGGVERIRVIHSQLKTSALREGYP
ncbi:MAG: nicotinamide-nucleotide adenylyltransferase [Thaumarchaeota archaeon]|nr:nicotinamide-nucleotide adenylyltransferase [Candidatus Calditenuaceae archaeon]MDW8187033.1 nicotinamide-nucleotide adenylyltransferase [Nitrososphaerota archaeon]